MTNQLKKCKIKIKEIIGVDIVVNRLFSDKLSAGSEIQLVFKENRLEFFLS